MPSIDFIKEIQENDRKTFFKDFENFYDFLHCSSLSFFGIDTPKNDLKVFEKLKKINEDENVKLSLLISLCNHNTTLIKEKLKPDNNFLSRLCFLDEIANDKIVITNKTELKLLLFIQRCKVHNTTAPR